MAKEPKKGDHVAWNTSQGQTTGTVVDVLTEPTSIKGHDVKASEEDPQYRVKSDKTGAEAAHHGEALKPAPTKDAG